MELPAAAEAVVEDQPSASDMPPSSSYLKVGDNLFVSMPGTASTGVPVEGETLDGDVIAATSSSGPKEEQLLQAMSDNFQKLQALHRA